MCAGPKKDKMRLWCRSTRSNFFAFLWSSARSSRSSHVGQTVDIRTSTSSFKEAHRKVLKLALFDYADAQTRDFCKFRAKVSGQRDSKPTRRRRIKFLREFKTFIRRRYILSRARENDCLCAVARSETRRCGIKRSPRAPVPHRELISPKLHHNYCRTIVMSGR